MSESSYPTTLQALLVRRPDLTPAAGALHAAFHVIAASQAQGGCLFLCGNGGSLADALHISAELLKSYTLSRPLDAQTRTRLGGIGPDGQMLAGVLQRGLRAVVLGLNHSLASALENDVEAPGIGYAQELLVLARPGDVLLGISTSGNARNVCYAAQAAHACDVQVIAFTGRGGGRLANLADVVVRAPAVQTDRVQEDHVALYHCLCEMLEAHFFGG